MARDFPVFAAEIKERLAFVHFRETPPEQKSIRFQVPPPEKTTFVMFRLSPDGRRIAFVALDSSDKSELTLVTCYPFHYIGAAPRRFVVQAALVSGR